MDARGRRIDTARILGNIVPVMGLLITIVGLMTDSTPTKGYLFAGMPLLVGIGLRLGAAITNRR